jgi:hypothetical protein
MMAPARSVPAVSSPLVPVDDPDVPEDDDAEPADAEVNNPPIDPALEDDAR